jgi:threonylcarbamoyladenosine tRNA methylthiotransferase MtaB
MTTIPIMLHDASATQKDEPVPVPHAAMRVVTLGCRVNQVEGEWLRQCGRQRGYRQLDEDDTTIPADLVVINTCSVTGESDRQARQQIRRAIRDNPQACVVVTGCYAQRCPDQLAAIPGVRYVLGNSDKDRFGDLLDQLVPALPVAADVEMDMDTAVWHTPEFGRPPWQGLAVDRVADRSRAYLQVQTGCNERCSFCLIPRVRGPSRSLEVAGIVRQAQQFVRAGLREVVITGINLGQYGHDRGRGSTPEHSLTGLLRHLLTTVIPAHGVRLALSSLDPVDVEDGLIQLFAEEPRLTPHMHLSVQSGDAMILRRMHRRHQPEDVLRLTERLRAARPGMVFGADVIAGFPTESADAFENSCHLVETAGLALLHVFRYSDRPGTPAAGIPARYRVPPQEIQRRAERLRACGQHQLADVMAGSVGKRASVLIESVRDDRWTGRTEWFIPVTMAMTDDHHSMTEHQVGTLVPMVLTGFDQALGGFTSGSLIQTCSETAIA